MRLANCKRRFKTGLPITAAAVVRESNDSSGFSLHKLRAPTARTWWRKFFANFVTVGDLSSTILELARNGLLNPNVGLYAQTGANGYIGNYSSSSYNALLMSVAQALLQQPADRLRLFVFALDRQPVEHHQRREPVHVQRAGTDLRLDEPANVPGGLTVRCAAHRQRELCLRFAGRSAAHRFLGEREHLGEHDRRRVVDLGHLKLSHGLPVHDAYRDVPDQLHAGRTGRFRR